MKVLIKNSLMNKDIRLQIEHAKNSVIDLDKFDVLVQQQKQDEQNEQTYIKFFGKKQTQTLKDDFSDFKKDHLELDEESQADERKRSFKKKVKKIFEEKTTNKKFIKKRDVQLVSNSSGKASIDNDVSKDQDQNDFNILKMKIPQKDELQEYLQRLENELDHLDDFKKKNAMDQPKSKIDF